MQLLLPEVSLMGLLFAEPRFEEEVSEDEKNPRESDVAASCSSLCRSHERPPSRHAW
jgi:hypothetical protein